MVCDLQTRYVDVIYCWRDRLVAYYAIIATEQGVKAVRVIERHKVRRKAPTLFQIIRRCSIVGSERVVGGQNGISLPEMCRHGLLFLLLPIDCSFMSKEAGQKMSLSLSSSHPLDRTFQHTSRYCKATHPPPYLVEPSSSIPEELLRTLLRYQHTASLWICIG
ncbi:uncharacterized protein M421DRAFT_304138 [Didymella exigua CBS 183.55]|uniref:Uncharacterized protein n=1 Tax=Didymella exigua CBS 183.55 TaxID=1150837 RepID=A0A6A5R9M5_9PLEO|nr:uncharacterized protein M421DRAFT_304138 [Didymella exigua CBS 183.55]KAF1923898.1 hypothetical protein M421DRAFT_304138 [Didymella exigua CBS 183.55]